MLQSGLSFELFFKHIETQPVLCHVRKSAKTLVKMVCGHYLAKEPDCTRTKKEMQAQLLRRTANDDSERLVQVKLPTEIT
mgnify:CR=1 FL=1